MAAIETCVFVWIGIGGSPFYLPVETFGWKQDFDKTFSEASPFHSSIWASRTVGMRLNYLGNRKLVSKSTDSVLPDVPGVLTFPNKLCCRYFVIPVGQKT